ncbi:MAG: GatB/YqeY domain-containing protein [Candidatus Omnitrophica bacterium]|jgi:hypothetical protein|nr:GatB/YqeY domain-containing protein [Candidatus Omnitrophota bacterium]
MLKDRIDSDLKNALKNRDAATVSTLRFLKSAMQNLSIEKRKELDDEDVISVIKRQIKQRRDSIEGFRQGNRMDLVEKEQLEINILSVYLPKSLSMEELLLIVKESMAEVKAASVKDMGNVIKCVLSKTKGAADASMVSSITKAELSKIE